MRLARLFESMAVWKRWGNGLIRNRNLYCTQRVERFGSARKMVCVVVLLFENIFFSGNQPPVACSYRDVVETRPRDGGSDQNIGCRRYSKLRFLQS